MQSSSQKCHHQQTNTQFFTGRMPSCRPINSVKTLKGTCRQHLLTTTTITSFVYCVTGPFSRAHSSLGRVLRRSSKEKPLGFLVTVQMPFLSPMMSKNWLAY